MKRALLFQILFFLLTFSCWGQPYDPAKVNKRAIPFYSQAMERIDDESYPLAVGLLQKAIEIDSTYVDAYLSLGGIYGKLRNYKNAVSIYEKAMALDSTYTVEYKYQYSVNLAGLGEFQEALDAINDLMIKKPPQSQVWQKRAANRKRAYEFGVEYARIHPDKGYVFTPKNMGNAINSAESEYFPNLTIDGKEMVFTRNLNGHNEDFFSSRKDSSGILSKAKPIEGNVNTEHNEGAQNISQDGQWLVFTGCNFPDGYGSCDIYLSYLTSSGWSNAINLGSVVNSEQWDSQPCLSPDKRDLYFASRRAGGYGGSDIYVSHLKPNGRWGEPENLGAGVNTSGDEQCPFMHADNQTLYFTSDTLQGYGDDDLFYVIKQPVGGWSKPVNLGYPINTIDREGTLFIVADGKTAYYASNRSDSRGGMDIYSFELREDIRPHKTLWIKGKVFDKKSGVGLPSTVELIDLASKQPLTKVQTNEKGDYLITLPIGKDYAFNVNRKGYLFYSDNFPLQHRSPDSVYEKNIPLQPIEANASIILKNVFFDVNKFDLKPESQAELDKVVQLLNDNPALKIEISGHTDNVGKPGDNLILSNNRAKAVTDYITSKNIAAQRLTAKGYGETKPVSDNKTEEGRGMNRRTEMRVIGD